MASKPEFFCYFEGCETRYSDIYEVGRHFKRAHKPHTWEIKVAHKYNEDLAFGPARARLPDEMDAPESSKGRPQREKKPTEKVKAVSVKPEAEQNKEYIVPPKYIAPADDPKFIQEPREITKTLDHIKTSQITGEMIEFYKLGIHAESKDKHHYIRAQRDAETGYFHNTEAPPHHARLSDENHPLCAVEHVDICFTKDMLGMTHDRGHVCARANVFAREGTYFFETKLVSISQEGMERQDEPLITSEIKKGLTKQDTCRGSVRVGFVRREHHHSQGVGNTGYSYAVVAFGKATEEYGNVRSQGLTSFVKPKNPGRMREGDVIGLMITLPPLSIHQKVAEGTFDQARDAPDLKCGPYVPKKAPASSSKLGKKRGPKSKGKEKATEKDTTPAAEPSTSAAANVAATTTSLPPPLTAVNIIRDRAPFEHKKIIYLEYPEYAPQRDIVTYAPGKGKSLNPETNEVWNLATDTHPHHPIPYLRTLPGSKIEMWLNGEYQGVVAEHLLAFLPPCSTIDKTSKTQGSGPLDDGTLGYYPALTTYGGGAATVKFDEPFDFAPQDREFKPFGARYNDQVIDDFVADLVDEACWEKVDEEFELPSLAPKKSGLSSLVPKKD